MRPNALPLPCPGGSIVDTTTAVVPVSARIADLLRPVRTVPRYGEFGYEGVTEIWEARPTIAADLPNLKRQLHLVESALHPGDPGAILGRIHGLLAHYRVPELPESVERAVAADWLADLCEFPLSVVEEGCKRHRRNPSKFRFRPLPGDIRAICLEIVHDAVVMRDRVRKLIAGIPKIDDAKSAGYTKASYIQARIVALAAAKRMP